MEAALDMKPRDYQSEALEKALKGNLIMIGDTGVGKTLVAMMLIQNFFRNNIQPSVYFSSHEKPDVSVKWAIFLAPTQQLVRQQAERMENFTGLPIRSFVGSEVDTITTFDLHSQLRKIDVLTMTPGALLNLLYRGRDYIAMENVGVLVLDECHGARKRHPYVRIMSFYNAIPEGVQRPKIFGMTASPTPECAGVLNCSEYLCDPMEESVRIHAAVPATTCIPYPAIQMIHMSGPQEVLRNLLSLCFSPGMFRTMDPEEIPTITRTVACTLHGYGLWPALRHALLILEFRWSREYAIYRADKERNDRIRNLLGYLLLQLKRAASCSTSSGEKHGMPKALHKLCTPKLHALTQLLLMMTPSTSEIKRCGFRCMVFVERRITARVICDLLRWLYGSTFGSSTEEALKIRQRPLLKCGYIVGSTMTCHRTLNNCPSLETERQIELEEKQAVKAAKAMRAFKSGQLHILVTTDACSEGIDVPECGLVVALDPLKHVRHLMHTRGRTRAAGGRFCVMVEEPGGQFQKLESMIADAEMVRRNMLGHEIKSNSEPLGNTYRYMQQYFPSSGARLDLDAAVSLLHEVQQALRIPFLPIFAYENQGISGAHKCVVHLPACLNLGDERKTDSDEISSVVASQGITYAGVLEPEFYEKRFPPCKNKREAKAVAAFVACCRLHRAGILSDQLTIMPNTARLSLHNYIGFDSALRDNHSKVNLPPATFQNLGVPPLLDNISHLKLGTYRSPSASSTEIPHPENRIFTGIHGKNYGNNMPPKISPLKKRTPIPPYLNISDNEKVITSKSDNVLSESLSSISNEDIQITETLGLPPLRQITSENQISESYSSGKSTQNTLKMQVFVYELPVAQVPGKASALTCSHKMGILVRKRLPQGVLETCLARGHVLKLDPTLDGVYLSDRELYAVSQCHVALVLPVILTSMTPNSKVIEFDESADKGYCLVPLNQESYGIDWFAVQSVVKEYNATENLLKKSNDTSCNCPECQSDVQIEVKSREQNRCTNSEEKLGENFGSSVVLEQSFNAISSENYAEDSKKITKKNVKYCDKAGENAYASIIEVLNSSTNPELDPNTEKNCSGSEKLTSMEEFEAGISCRHITQNALFDSLHTVDTLSVLDLNPESNQEDVLILNLNDAANSLASLSEHLQECKYRSNSYSEKELNQENVLVSTSLNPATRCVQYSKYDYLNQGSMVMLVKAPEGSKHSRHKFFILRKIPCELNLGEFRELMHTSYRNRYSQFLEQEKNEQKFGETSEDKNEIILEKKSKIVGEISEKNQIFMDTFENSVTRNVGDEKNEHEQKRLKMDIKVHREGEFSDHSAQIKGKEKVIKIDEKSTKQMEMSVSIDSSQLGSSTKTMTNMKIGEIPQLSCIKQEQGKKRKLIPKQEKNEEANSGKRQKAEKNDGGSHEKLVFSNLHEDNCNMYKQDMILTKSSTISNSIEKLDLKIDKNNTETTRNSQSKWENNRKSNKKLQNMEEVLKQKIDIIRFEDEDKEFFPTFYQDIEDNNTKSPEHNKNEICNEIRAFRRSFRRIQFYMDLDKNDVKILDEKPEREPNLDEKRIEKTHTLERPPNYLEEGQIERGIKRSVDGEIVHSKNDSMGLEKVGLTPVSFLYTISKRIMSSLDQESYLYPTIQLPCGSNIFKSSLSKLLDVNHDSSDLPPPELTGTGWGGLFENSRVPGCPDIKLLLPVHQCFPRIYPPARLLIGAASSLTSSFVLEKSLMAWNLREKLRIPCGVKAVEISLRRPANERLETLGDAWLKYYMSLVVMQVKPFLMEESLITEFRSNLICNVRLTKEAKQSGLTAYIHPPRSMCGKPFESYWMPPFISPPKESMVGSKTPADIVEALLGCCLIGKGEASPQAVIHGLGLPTLPNYTPLPLSDVQEVGLDEALEAITKGGPTGPWSLKGGEELAQQLRALPPDCFIPIEYTFTKPIWTIVQSFLKLENALGYTFANKWLLLQSVTHPSYTTLDHGRAWRCEPMEGNFAAKYVTAFDYQRLELLGDALLSYLTTTQLFLFEEEYGTDSPEAITVKVARCVRNSVLATVGVQKLSLHTHLRCSPGLSMAVESFSRELQEEGVRCDEKIPPPKALADAFEALMAAVYLDSGFDMSQVCRIFWPLLEVYARDFLGNDFPSKKNNKKVEDADSDCSIDIDNSDFSVNPENAKCFNEGALASLLEIGLHVFPEFDESRI